VTEYSWLETREKAVSLFGGELPQAATEEAVLDYFRERPGLVVNLIADVAEAKKAGRARSGWAILRKRLGDYNNGEDETVTDNTDRQLRQTVAEVHIRTALLYCDRESEAMDALFGHFGLLRAYAGDEVLRQRMLDLYREERPRGEASELAELERADQRRERLHIAPWTPPTKRPRTREVEA